MSELVDPVDEPLMEQVDAQLATIATERERIAGELHDDSVQAMTAVSLQLQRVASRVVDDETAALVMRAREITDAAIDRLRHMLFVLHPATLEDDGLVGTLEIYFETHVDPDLEIEWSVSGSIEPEPPLGVTALAFRLAREAISNAVRHGEPSRIAVEVTADESVLMVRVSDNGIGFDPGRDIGRRPGHLGLKHSRALAKAALGRYTVTSRQGTGTEVTIELPVSV